MPVDVRPATPGEVVVSVIKGEGKETQSPPAQAGDMVVRNRCEATGNEEILVTAAKFAERYEGPVGPAGPDGWQPYRPKGVTMLYLTLGARRGPVQLRGTVGRTHGGAPGDAIVQDPQDPGDTYRIAAEAFACTYEVVEPASRRLTRQVGRGPACRAAEPCLSGGGRARTRPWPARPPSPRW